MTIIGSVVPCVRQFPRARSPPPSARRVAEVVRATLTPGLRAKCVGEPEWRTRVDGEGAVCVSVSLALATRVPGEAGEWCTFCVRVLRGQNLEDARCAARRVRGSIARATMLSIR